MKTLTEIDSASTIISADVQEAKVFKKKYRWPESASICIVVADGERGLGDWMLVRSDRLPLAAIVSLFGNKVQQRVVT